MHTLLLLSFPGGGEMVLILLVVLLMFGGKKIPELARGLGRGIREFNQAKSSIQQELEEGLDDDVATQRSKKGSTVSKD